MCRLRVLTLSACASLGLLLPAAFAHAETIPGSIGNLEGTVSSDVGWAGLSANGNSNGVKQKFTVSATARPLVLYVPIFQQGTPNSTVTVRLCSAAADANADPCSIELATGTYATGSLPSTRAAAFAAPTELVIPDGAVLYPSVTYVVAVTRPQDASSALTRIPFEAAGYSDGTLHNKLLTCADGWYTTESTASSCSGTEWATYDIFFGLDTSGGQLTLTLSQNGPQVFATGLCVEPEDLPDGWQLFSNAVALSYYDTSASGTWITGTADCVDGSYTTFPNGELLWNASWRVEASQGGSPVSFEAETSLTMTGSEVTNPMVALGYDACDHDLAESFTTNGATCWIRSVLFSLLTFPPFSWFRQVDNAIRTGSATSTLDVTLAVPAIGSSSSHDIVLFQTGATSTGIVGQLNSIGTVGGFAWDELLEMSIWLGFLIYALRRSMTVFSEI